MAAERIDAHHHLWRYRAEEYPWIGGNMPPLTRDFLSEDLAEEAGGAGLNGAVAVQARQSMEETNWLLALAADSEIIRGVVGWAPICSERFPATVEKLTEQRKLVGLRHVIQDEPDDNFLCRADFNEGIGCLRGSGLVYDILIYERHLPNAIWFVDRHPQQAFVLDHLGKPKIREGVREPWASNIRELAKRENVYCKISGMVTEADWGKWSKADLQPFFDVVLEAFTPSRLLAGSDWPVCLLACSYQRWFRTLGELIGDLSPAERDEILGGVASKVYNLGRTVSGGVP
jgi:L-fuconolactonase